MTKLRFVGAAVLSLAVASSVTAANARSSEFQAGYHGRHVMHHMRAQDYDHFDYGIARPRHPSGWGGPYGDGEYPGTIDQNMGSSDW